MHEIRTHADLIASYGGGTAFAERIAKALGREADQQFVERMRDRAYKWRLNGIASQWLPTVARMVAADGIELPAHFFDPVAIPLPDTAHETPPTPASAPAGMPGRQLREQPCKQATADDIGQCHG